MKSITLTKDKVALVDDADYTELSEYKWYFLSTGYAVRDTVRAKVKTTILMHRVIMDAPKGMQVDHINGNKLDNRRENLRLCTSAQNMQNSNRKGYKNKFSVYKGVSKRGRKKNYHVKIKHNGKQIHLGDYYTEEEAARRYDLAAKELFGEFASLNFQEKEE